jgi:uncharacterized membrane protein HdeD (DUF308 family)
MSGQNVEVEGASSVRSSVTSRLDRPWWEPVARGVAFAVFGFLAVGYPDITTTGLALLFGTLALFEGAFQATGSLAARAGNPQWALLLLGGLFSILLGVWVLAIPDIDGLALLVLIGAWVLVSGVVQLVFGLRSGEAGPRRGLSVLGGLIGVGLGMACFTWPDATALSILWNIGVLAVLYGMQLIVLGLLDPAEDDRSTAAVST